MSKLYLFAIGGTGSRVLRSLTMMLAAGMEVEADEIVPIIIDPDVSNADLTRTVRLMDNYRSIRKHIDTVSMSEGSFFRREIKGLVPDYTLKIEDTDEKTFRQFISLSDLSRATGDKSTQAMMRMLFSEKNLNASMNVGFKGNPNIGSVVLNQIVTSEEFLKFANDFAQGDRIFIISSIFGGTGASGFPLLLKTLRTNKEIPNFHLINKAPIGAVTILPYFRLQVDDESEIDSSTFISKTKSALAYYEQNISKNNSIEAIYFIGDDTGNTYENHEGGSAQKNDAHLVEFLAATAVSDFAKAQFDEERSTVSKEFAIKGEEGDGVTFGSFYERDKALLFPPLTRFMLMAECLEHKFDYFRGKSFNANNDHFGGLYTSPFMTDLRQMIRDYLQWLAEMKGNRRSLDLFKLNSFAEPFDIVSGVTPKKIFSLKSNYDLIADRLNSAVKACKSGKEESRFLEMFYLATDKLVNEKYSL